MEDSPASEALRLLSTDPDSKPLWTFTYLPFLLGIPLGATYGFHRNYNKAMPMLSGIHRHFIAAGLFTAVIYYGMNKRREFYNERDAVYRHYIQLHPEDFVLEKPKKYSEIIQPWVPIR